MSDQLTAPADAARSATRRRPWRAPIAQAAAIVVCFAVVGALCGLLWEAVWDPAPGEVVKHVWYPISWDRAQPAYFAATGWYVVISIVAGVVLGALAAWRLDRAELLTLGAVVVGGLLGALLMRVVGLHVGPGNPQRLAKTAADGTRLPSQLRLSSWWLLLAFPGGALTGLSVVFLTISKRVSTGQLEATTPEGRSQ
jgi:Na+/H+-translocating membrane pyrophosphatase